MGGAEAPSKLQEHRLLLNWWQQHVIRETRHREHRFPAVLDTVHAFIAANDVASYDTAMNIGTVPNDGICLGWWFCEDAGCSQAAETVTADVKSGLPFAGLSLTCGWNRTYNVRTYNQVPSLQCQRRLC